MIEFLFKRHGIEEIAIGFVIDIIINMIVYKTPLGN